MQMHIYIYIYASALIATAATFQKILKYTQWLISKEFMQDAHKELHNFLVANFFHLLLAPPTLSRKCYEDLEGAKNLTCFILMQW